MSCSNLRRLCEMALLVAVLASQSVVATACASQPLVCRRACLGAAFAAATAAYAEPALSAEPEPLRVLTDEEMAARVARKQELLRAKERSSAPQPGGGFFNPNLDVNPEAAAALRSRSILDNAKASLAKQEELKARNKLQKRDDLCEMLGRGC